MAPFRDREAADPEQQNGVSRLNPVIEATENQVLPKHQAGRFGTIVFEDDPGAIDLPCFVECVPESSAKHPLFGRRHTVHDFEELAERLFR